MRQAHNALLNVGYAVPNVVSLVRIPGCKIDVTGAVRSQSVPAHPHRCQIEGALRRDLRIGQFVDDRCKSAGFPTQNPTTRHTSLEIAEAAKSSIDISI